MLDASDSASPLSYQARFHRAWGHLTRPAVRALAWLLDSPDLLDPASPHWQDRIATLGPPSAATATWLAALDADPARWKRRWATSSIPALACMLKS
ncbi:DUF1853 family protein [Massilia sp. MB5]|uniref:DUF1853 family protein n=1 Tax=Massilia sp. MB5 TaxID=2919578 RepID=UPI0027D9B99F|nr:DUF1853 family protein [Massilia sp. MB5]